MRAFVVPKKASDLLWTEVGIALFCTHTQLAGIAHLPCWYLQRLRLSSRVVQGALLQAEKGQYMHWNRMGVEDQAVRDLLSRAIFYLRYFHGFLPQWVDEIYLQSLPAFLPRTGKSESGSTKLDSPCLFVDINSRLTLFLHFVSQSALIDLWCSLLSRTAFSIRYNILLNVVSNWDCSRMHGGKCQKNEFDDSPRIESWQDTGKLWLDGTALTTLPLLLLAEWINLAKRLILQ